MKKLFSLILALVLVLGLAVPAFAADDETTYTITIDPMTPGHEYEAYQIFSGDISIVTTTEGEGDDAVTTTTKTLSNIQWGSGMAVPTDAAEYASFINVINNWLRLTGDDKLPDDASAREVAQKFSEAEIGRLKITLAYLEEGGYLGDIGSTPDEDGKITGLAPGYYLVRDITENLPEGDTYSDFMLEVVDDVTIEPKDSSVTVEKKVIDVNDSTGDTSDWQDSADYDIGDVIPFQIKGTVPANIADYVIDLIYTFEDNMSKGLTFNRDSVKIWLYASETAYQNDEGAIDITSEFDAESTTTDDDGNTIFKITCDHLEGLALADENEDAVVTGTSVLVMRYTCTLNEDAVEGAAGNPNTARIVYGSDPNYYVYGHTPYDKVTVFTFKLEVNKVDENGDPLAGATFVLYKFSDEEDDWVACGDPRVYVDGTSFDWDHLDDGKYKLVETVTPAGYNTMEDYEFTIESDHDETADDPELTELIVLDKDGNNITVGSGAIGTFTAVLESGIVATDIENLPGSILPSTGGVGTTIFYIVGAILVIGAGIILVARRRVND